MWKVSELGSRNGDAEVIDAYEVSRLGKISFTEEGVWRKTEETAWSWILLSFFCPLELKAYLRLLIFLSAILIPACVSSSPAFLMMYSAYKLNKQGDNIQLKPIWLQTPVFIPIPKKGNAKECSNYCTIALVSYTSKVMLKILQARLQQYVNFQMFKMDLEKAEEQETGSK